MDLKWIKQGHKGLRISVLYHNIRCRRSFRRRVTTLVNEVSSIFQTSFFPTTVSSCSRGSEVFSGQEKSSGVSQGLLEGTQEASSNIFKGLEPRQNHGAGHFGSLYQSRAFGGQSNAVSITFSHFLRTDGSQAEGLS